MEEMRNACRILVGKSKEKRSCRRFRHRWEDNIKLDFKEMGYEGVNWINFVFKWEVVVGSRNTLMVFCIP
jgi:hypothetical protein